LGRQLARNILPQCDTLWINDPTTGRFLLEHKSATYDVTDDWRTTRLTKRELRRLVGAEDVLAATVSTVVCSEVLKVRWKRRYGIEATVVNNAVDVAAIRGATGRHLGPDGPHVGYVGTLHDERLDVDLVVNTAAAMSRGRLHLVGPDSLTAESRRKLLCHDRISLHGSVPSSDVPSWLIGFDVLVSPHRVTPFTLSLDAIKAYEYLATPRPVVATPTSGFQELAVPGLVVTATGFVDAVIAASQQDESFRRDVPDWDDRAREFATALGQSVRRA
jgi:teichuronic acid biosynthesis glycosyltransferase TuaH